MGPAWPGTGAGRGAISCRGSVIWGLLVLVQGALALTVDAQLCERFQGDGPARGRARAAEHKGAELLSLGQGAVPGGHGSFQLLDPIMFLHSHLSKDLACPARDFR